MVYKRLKVGVHALPGRISRWAHSLALDLTPPRCLLCGGLGNRLDLCVHCEQALPPATPEFLSVESPLAGIFSPWRYEYPVDRLVRALKFQGDRSVARVLGSLLANRRVALGRPLPVLVVPVPLHSSRLRQRGYNQADEIARHVAATLGLERRGHALQRVRDTPPQSLLSAAARRQSPQGAFAATSSLAAARIALIDDVVTTGSTAQTAAGALVAAGAVHVELWALARAD